MSASAKFIAEITRNQRQLHAFVLSMVWHPVEADDVLQETNLVLWQKAAEFDESRPFLPWAIRFAQFQALAHLKRLHRQHGRLLIDDDLAKIMADEAAAEERIYEVRRIALANCLQKLTARQRELVWRRYEPDATVADMATAAKIAPKALSERLRRIRHTLLECVRKTLAEESFA
jgi:RNA polymerase sigma-70 factor (ECF subfamily)